MLSVRTTLQPRLCAILAVSGLVLGVGCASEAESIAQPSLEAPELRTTDERPVAAPRAKSAVKPVAFATLGLYAAASASPEGITFTGHVTVLKIAARCYARFVDFSAARFVSGPPTMGDEPSVAIIEQRFCVRVLANPALNKLVGERALLRPVTLSEFLNGEEYSSPDPADLQAAGVSVYLPDDRFGHQIGVFVLAGYLETPDGFTRQANSLVGATVTSGGHGLPEQRYLLSLLSPAGTAVNVMGRAPTVELGVPE